MYNDNRCFMCIIKHLLNGLKLLNYGEMTVTETPVVKCSEKPLKMFELKLEHGQQVRGSI